MYVIIIGIFGSIYISRVQNSYETVQYTVQYGPVPLKYSTVQYSTVQYSTVQYSIVQLTVQYSTVQYR